MDTLTSSKAEPPSLGSNPQRNDALIRAADELLDESGLEGLTIRAVLLRSGLARRAFYEQFNGKDDLVLAVFERTLSFAAEHFRQEAEHAADPVEALRRIVDGLVIGQLGFGGPGTGRRSAALSREHLRLAESRPQELQKALSPLIALIAEELAKGVAMGLLRECDPRLQASLVYNFVSATIHVELLAEEGGQPDRARRDQLAGVIWEFCRRAVIV
ncbi:TetR/AcrR family transcriptional regulator [Novosphingobium sp. 9U]|uniref:TetR/AcrR family transcriptional regulator n=1 Tax=Novosphingobium sp. 9U TaxID=2653158 RepID=UPI0012EF934A|nr:TetR/AcrR family transcriptional regulator [Novosphingobium sp. 9U]VWX46522.1 TetR family transcriptional regulator [Novosphingobium sp. 9U]